MRWYLIATLLPLVGLLGISAPTPKDKPEDFGPVTEKQLKKSEENLKQILIAMHSYHDAVGFFPGDSLDKDGKPLLSWRVMLLPYLEEVKLYESFKLDEPWDSEHNIKLVEKLPAIYAPVRVKTKDPGYTFYRGFMAKDCVFEPKVKLSLLRITDGTSNTIAILEAGEAVVWTKPGTDLPYDKAKNLPKLGGMFEGDFHVALCDGSVHKVNGKKMNADEFKKMITCSDGEVNDMDKAFGKE